MAVDVWDFAGRHPHHAYHPIFFSSHAVYILVHNLSEPLQALAQPCLKRRTLDMNWENPNETNMDNLLSWLVTVHGLVQVKKETGIAAQRLPCLLPQVFIVGTHADKPVEDIAVIKSQIQARISGTEYEKLVVPPLLSIDNTCAKMWNRMEGFLSQGPRKRKHQTGIKLPNAWPFNI